MVRGFPNEYHLPFLKNVQRGVCLCNEEDLNVTIVGSQTN